MRRKEFWPLYNSRKLIDAFIPKLCHEADGLILQVGAVAVLVEGCSCVVGGGLRIWGNTLNPDPPLDPKHLAHGPLSLNPDPTAS